LIILFLRFNLNFGSLLVLTVKKIIGFMLSLEQFLVLCFLDLLLILQAIFRVGYSFFRSIPIEDHCKLYLREFAERDVCQALKGGPKHWRELEDLAVARTYWPVLFDKRFYIGLLILELINDGILRVLEQEKQDISIVQFIKLGPCERKINAKLELTGKHRQRTLVIVK
jgi:hypothetical protein